MIYILLPVYNRREITRRFIDCLNAQTYTNYHLVLIDDGCTDGTAEMVQSHISNVTVISGEGNWWWAGSLQQGYQWLRKKRSNHSDTVLLINDDAFIADDFLAIGTKILQENPDTLVGAQAYNKLDNSLLDVGVHVDWKKFSFTQANTPEDINCLSTRGLFIKEKDFLNLGGFYPRILPHYLSDYEFTIRAHKKGMRLITNNNLRLISDENLTGFHSISYDESFIKFLQKYFSKKSANNPIYWITFILLICPWHLKMLNFLKAFYGGIKTIVIRLIKQKRTVNITKFHY